MHWFYLRYRLVALDMRDHGETITSNDLDLSSETLSKVCCPLSLDKKC